MCGGGSKKGSIGNYLVQMKKSSNEIKNSSNEQYINSFELLFISTTHMVPRAVVRTNQSSNEQ